MTSVQPGRGPVFGKRTGDFSGPGVKLSGREGRGTISEHRKSHRAAANSEGAPVVETAAETGSESRDFSKIALNQQ